MTTNEKESRREGARDERESTNEQDREEELKQYYVDSGE